VIGRRRRVSRSVAILAAVSVFLACGAPREGSSREDLHAALYSDPTSLSLIGNTDQNASILARLITDALVDYDGDLALQPRVAESWELSADGKTLTFHLREGVRWHDGSPVTAADVVFTVERVRDPETQARSWMGLFQDVESVEAVDARTVVAKYSRVYADFLDAWRVPLIPAHALGPDEEFLTSGFARHPIGCGPYRFVSWTPGSEVVLASHEDHWSGAPTLKKIVFHVVPDERTAFEALLRGDIDLLGLTPDLWREARAGRIGDGFRIERVSRLALWNVAWNMDGTNPFFKEPRVHQAMTLALDRERFLEQALEGLGRPAATPWLPGTPWHDPSVEPWPFDPGGAADRLEETGWTDSDGDGVRDRDGVPFSFTLLLPATAQAATTDRMAAWMQERLAAIGVRMEVERLEWRAFLERRRSREFHAAMASLVFTPSPDLYDLLHSSAARGGYNYPGIADPEIDRLLEEGRNTLDPEARRKVYFRLQERVRELEPMACLFQFSQVVLIDAALRGPRPSPLGVFDSRPGPERWTWSAD
jgi:peptide/nickel transport system substrate-binding protein